MEQQKETPLTPEEAQALTPEQTQALIAAADEVATPRQRAFANPTPDEIRRGLQGAGVDVGPIPEAHDGATTSVKPEVDPGHIAVINEIGATALEDRERFGDRTLGDEIADSNRPNRTEPTG